MKKVTFDWREPNTVWTEEAARTLIGQIVPFRDRQIEGVALDLGDVRVMSAEVLDRGTALRLTVELVDE